MLVTSAKDIPRNYVIKQLMVLINTDDQEKIEALAGMYFRHKWTHPHLHPLHMLLAKFEGDEGDGRHLIGRPINLVITGLRQYAKYQLQIALVKMKKNITGTPLPHIVVGSTTELQKSAMERLLTPDPSSILKDLYMISEIGFERHLIVAGQIAARVIDPHLEPPPPDPRVKHGPSDDDLSIEKFSAVVIPPTPPSTRRSADMRVVRMAGPPVESEERRSSERSLSPPASKKPSPVALLATPAPAPAPASSSIPLPWDSSSSMEEGEREEEKSKKEKGTRAKEESSEAGSGEPSEDARDDVEEESEGDRDRSAEDYQPARKVPLAKPPKKYRAGDIFDGKYVLQVGKRGGMFYIDEKGKRRYPNIAKNLIETTPAPPQPAPPAKKKTGPVEKEVTSPPLPDKDIVKHVEVGLKDKSVRVMKLVSGKS